MNDQLYKPQRIFFSGDDGLIKSLADSPSFHIDSLELKVCLRVAQETKYYHWARRLDAVNILGRNIIGKDIIGQYRDINKFILEKILIFREDENNHVRRSVSEWTTNYDEALTYCINHMKTFEDRIKEESFWKKIAFKTRIKKSNLTEYLLVQKDGPYTQRINEARLELTVVRRVS